MKHGIKHGTKMGGYLTPSMKTPHTEDKGGEDTTHPVKAEMVKYPRASLKNGYK